MRKKKKNRARRRQSGREEETESGGDTPGGNSRPLWGQFLPKGDRTGSQEMKKPSYKDADTRVMSRCQYFVDEKKQQPQLIIRLEVSEAVERACALLYFRNLLDIAHWM